MSSNPNTAKKLTAGIITAILLALCLCVTTFALVYTSVELENNLFRTGTVDINLHDGEPIIEAHEFLFEPGMTVEKDFFLENRSTWDVYYRLYFANVTGNLANVLEITIRNDDTVLYQGTAASLNRDAVSAADEPLLLGETKWLSITFHFPETSGNTAQSAQLAFDLCADAVQTKNNPNKLFD